MSDSESKGTKKVCNRGLIYAKEDKKSDDVIEEKKICTNYIFSGKKVLEGENEMEIA